MEELTRYVLITDRRLLVMREFQNRQILQASDIAEKVGRSLQNISHALKDLEEKGVVTPLVKGRRTWKRYMLSEKGKRVLKELKKRELL